MKIGRGQRSGNLRMHIVPILVWLAASAVVVFMFRSRARRFEVFGLALGQVREISSTSTGRLLNVPVQLFQQVKEGDPVAVVDTVLDHKHLKEELEAKRRVFLAQIDRLKAQLKATEDQMAAEASVQAADEVMDQRRLAVDVENARLHVLELNAQLETDQLALEQLQLDKKIFIAQGRLRQEGASQYELQKTEAAYNTLLKKIKASEFLLSQARQDLKYAQKRYDDFASRQTRKPSIDLALDVIRKEIDVQEQSIAEMLQSRAALVIKSPFDGVVSAIERSPGEAILPGEPILSISESEPREIIAFANRSELERIRINMKVELKKSGEPIQVAYSQITHLGPNVQLMPEQLRANPAVPQWGRPILIKIPPGFKLIPGELVRVRAM